MPANKSKYILSFMSFFIVLNSFGQSEWKNWDGVSVNFGLTKKLELGISHLRSYTITNSFKNTFNQSSLNLDYDFTKRLSIKAGFTLTHFPLDSVSTNRFLVRGTYKIPLGEILSWSNGLQAEIHSANERHYNYRIIYITRFALQHRLNFLRLSPSISYWLYYNIGGNTIQYYDESGSPLVKETPDGLHRGRFIVNLNSKINKNLSLSLYYLNQHEFNLAGNDINVVNPSTGKIARPFRNYQVAGLSVSVSFDLYKKHKKKSTKK